MASSNLIDRLRSRAAYQIGKVVRQLSVRVRTRRLSGPEHVTLAPDEVAVVCLMKNGGYYIGELLRHHRALGVSHFVFLDNGSDDGAPAELATCPDVTVLQNTLPPARYESLLRTHAARRCVRGGWVLFVDTDELAEMPDNEGRSIRDYTGYCNAQGFTAVVSQMLDLFSSAPLSETQTWSYGETIEKFDLYSLADIRCMAYHDPAGPLSGLLVSNSIPNDDIDFKLGGLRKTLFDEDCVLTKHSLVRNDPRIGLSTHPHCSSGVNCADFTMLIRHYKFAGSFLQRERREVAAGTWEHGENARRMRAIADASYVIESPDARRLITPAQLVREGFLVGAETMETSSGTGS